MSGYDDLERQLLDSVGRRGRPGFAPPARWRFRPIGLSGMVIAASCVLVLAVAGFALVSLGHNKAAKRGPVLTTGPHRSAQVGGPGGQRELNYVNGAMYATVARDPACRLGAGNSSVGTAAAINEGTPSATMLSVLGVLRRRATPADKLPDVFYANGRLVLAAKSVYVRYIRLARTVGGESYWIVPEAGAGAPARPAGTLNRCYAEEMHALRKELANVRPSIRAATLSLGATVLGQTRHAEATNRMHEGVSVFEWGSRGGVSGGGASPEIIEQHGMLGSWGPVLDGVVPSGVVTVTLEYPASGRGTNRLPPLTVTTDVVNNIFVVSIPRADGGHFPPKMIWRSAQGTVIKKVSRAY